MRGIFVKDGELILPVNLFHEDNVTNVIIVTPTAGLSGGDIGGKFLIQPDGTKVNIADAKVSEISDGAYRITISGALVNAVGPYMIILSNAADVKRQEIHFQITTNDLDSLATQSDVSTLSAANQAQGVTLNAAGKTAAADAVLDEQMSGHVAAGSLGKAIADIPADVWSESTRTLTALGAGAVDAIWDELTAGHSTAGSFGKLIIDNLDAAISDVITDLDDIKGTGFVKDTHSLKQILSAVTGALSINLTDADKNAIAGEVWKYAVAASMSGASAGKALVLARALASGKLEVQSDGNTMELYDTDNTTLLATFNITRDADSKVTTRST
jgi:hypothetical protein